MNIKYITLIFILFIIILTGIKLITANIEKFGGLQFAIADMNKSLVAMGIPLPTQSTNQYSIFHYDGQITEYGADKKYHTEESNRLNTSDLSIWKNVDAMKKIASDCSYTVNDWGTHIDIIVNKLGCSYYGYDKKTGKWTRKWRDEEVTYENTRYEYRYGKRYEVKYNRKEIERRPYIDEDITHTFYYEIDAEDYTKMLSQIVSKLKINNDADLQKMIDFHNSNNQTNQNNPNNNTQLQNLLNFFNSIRLQNWFKINKPNEKFSTIEGFDLGLVSKSNIVVKKSGSEILNQNSVNMLTNKDYSVLSNYYPDFIKNYTSKGKNLNDVQTHITTMKTFGITNENVYDYLNYLVNTKLNARKYTFLETDVLINNYFRSYSIENVTDLFDASTGSLSEKTNVNDGAFTKTAMRFDLHNINIPLFPTSSTGNSCIMEKLKAINSINIPTVGKNNKGGYNTDEFFQAFQAYNINSQQFFNEIYSNYSKLSIQNSSNDIDKTLHYISSFYQGDLIKSFKELDTNLSTTGLSLNDYIEYSSILSKRVGSPPYDSIANTWITFKNYYSNIAYSDVYKFQYDNPVKPNTLTKFLDDIDIYYANNAPADSKSNSQNYFYNGGGDFSKFISVLNDKKYTVSDVKRDIMLGQFYSRFISINNEPEYFSNMGLDLGSSQYNPFSYIYNNISSIFNSIFNSFYGETEEFSPDASILNEFGLSNFDSDLKTLEEVLTGYNIDEINRTKTTWQNIMSFVTVLVKIGIFYPDMKNFIGTLRSIGANDIKEWYSVIKKLSYINIKGGSTIQNFLNIVNTFGVRYNYNLDEFIENMVIFKSDFSSGSLIPLTIFIEDMKKLNYTYETESGKVDINKIIKYFSTFEFTLNDYYSNGEIKIDSCNITLLPSFPHLFINSLYEYSNTSSYGNNLDDILQTKNLFGVCQSVGAMQQAYMITMGLQEYNKTPAIIIPNVTLIVSFFYKEEMDEIINNPNFYLDMSGRVQRVQLMNDVASVMIMYADTTFKDINNYTYNLYINIASFLQMFPALAFQYLSNEFLSKCSNGNCSYDIYMNPNFTECKASTSNKTVNLRPYPPIVQSKQLK
jgi:hypothetical protein